jgi:hypothetical protein
MFARFQSRLRYFGQHIIGCGNDYNIHFRIVKNGPPTLGNCSSWNRLGQCQGPFGHHIDTGHQPSAA